MRLYSNLNVLYCWYNLYCFRTIVMLILVKMVITAIARLLLAKPTCFCVVIYVCNVYLKYDNTSSLRKINLKNIYWTSMMLSKRARLKGLIELCMEFYFNRTTVRTESPNIRGNHIYYLSTELSCKRCNKKRANKHIYFLIIQKRANVPFISSQSSIV